MTHSTTGAGRVDDRSDRWRSVGLLVTSWLMWLFIGAWVITPSSILSLVMGDFGVREAAAAWIITAPQIAATITGIPIGIFLDRIDQRNAILAATGFLGLVGVGGTVAAGMGSYGVLVALRVLGGVSLVTIWTAQTALITRAFPSGVKATAVSIFVTGYPAGYAFGQFSGPVIADTLDWTATFALYTVLGFGFAVVFWLVARGVGGSGSDRTMSVPSRADLGRALSNPGVWGIAVIGFLSYMLYMIFNGWMPTYLSRTFEIGLAESGFYTALFPAIGILARPVGGLLSERVFGDRGRPVVGISYVIAGTAVLGMIFGSSLGVLLAGLVGAGFAIQLQFGLIYTMAQEYVPLNVASTTVALVSAIGWLGMFIGPPAVGALIEVSGSYNVIFLAAIALAFGGLLTALAISEPDATS